jgi:hypothetical protein
MFGGEFAMLLGIRKRIEKKFKEAGATSEDKAVALEKLGMDRREQNMFRHLLENGVIKKTADNRFFLDIR